MDFIQTYSELKKAKGVTLREIVRGLFLDGISCYSSIMDKWDQLLNKPRVQFLYIHHIFKDEEQALDNLLKELAVHHTFISHSEAVNRVLTGQIDKPYISISSDDGLKNNIRAAEILNRYNIKACFFICPAIIGETDINKIAAFSNQRLHFPPIEFMNWNDISHLQTQGHEIGGHTMNHVNLASINEGEQRYEIKECLESVRSHCGEALHFAYPYGRFFHFSEAARQMVFDSGFKSCISAERGCHVNANEGPLNYEDMLFRRDHIVMTWPIKHIFYFLVINSRKANVDNNYFKYQ